MCVAGLASSAHADDTLRRLADYRFANDAWDIRPAYEPDTGVVSAIVAVAKADAVIGDNLNVVLFLRDGTQWQAWSWANATRAQGVYSAKMILNISDDDDAKWELDEELPWLGEEPPRPPTPYMAGMLTDDPLFEPVMNSSNPAALVSMLADLGYPVATAGRPLEGGGESNGTCFENEVPMLMAMASGAEWGMTQVVSDEITGQFVTDAVSAFIPLCLPPLCIPSSTTTTGPVIATTNCYYAYINLSLTTVLGGFTATCNYEARRQFKQNRTISGVSLFCVPYTCSQIRLGWAAVPVTCTIFVPNATGFGCPPQPSCAGPASANAVCTAATPTFWNPWGPPCP